MTNKETTYTVQIQCFNLGELSNNSFDTVEFDFVPRADDTILLSDIYYDIKSVMCNGSNPREITIYVNLIGNSAAYCKFLKSEKSLKDIVKKKVTRVI